MVGIASFVVATLVIIFSGAPRQTEQAATRRIATPRNAANAALTRRIRADTATALHLDNV
jgi:hypothetical protein